MPIHVALGTFGSADRSLSQRLRSTPPSVRARCISSRYQERSRRRRGVILQGSEIRSSVPPCRASSVVALLPTTRGPACFRLGTTNLILPAPLVLHLRATLRGAIRCNGISAYWTLRLASRFPSASTTRYPLFPAAEPVLRPPRSLNGSPSADRQQHAIPSRSLYPFLVIVFAGHFLHLTFSFTCISAFFLIFARLMPSSLILILTAVGYIWVSSLRFLLIFGLLMYPADITSLLFGLGTQG